ncbi:MAG: hypothetical protein AAGB13_08680 [Cyanobacteria bacterium P01_F01_bin.33]
MIRWFAIATAGLLLMSSTPVDARPMQAARGTGIASGRGVVKVNRGVARGRGVGITRDDNGNLSIHRGSGTVAGQSILVGRWTVAGRGAAVGRVRGQNLHR